MVGRGSAPATALAESAAAGTGALRSLAPVLAVDRARQAPASDRLCSGGQTRQARWQASCPPGEPACAPPPLARHFFHQTRGSRENALDRQVAGSARAPWHWSLHHRPALVTLGVLWHTHKALPQTQLSVHPCLTDLFFFFSNKVTFGVNGEYNIKVQVEKHMIGLNKARPHQTGKTHISYCFS